MFCEMFGGIKFFVVSAQTVCCWIPFVTVSKKVIERIVFLWETNVWAQQSKQSCIFQRMKEESKTKDLLSFHMLSFVDGGAFQMQPVNVQSDLCTQFLSIKSITKRWITRYNLIIMQWCWHFSHTGYTAQITCAGKATNK